MKILSVDDDPFALKLLARQLTTLGFTDVISCESGHDALATLNVHGASFDLIFCDLQMPDMDGVEFVRHLMGASYAGALILISGEDERVLQSVEKLAQAHRLNVLGGLNKPVSPSQLTQMLDRHVSHRAAVSPAVRKTYDADELRAALAGRQLLNYYQPKVEFASGRVCGVETLVRWNHPRDGLVYPDQFIGTAEEHGLIDELTYCVLVAAARQARAWQDLGFALQVAVNVSMDNLDALEFPDMVAQVAKNAGIPLNRLMLEVTESRLMRDSRAVLDILSRLRLKHVGLSIDDFGTGHSSLAQLRDLPFNELKIDRSFVHGACRDASLGIIFKASLAMARQLGMNTVAEGVEDRDDWDFLVAAGCDQAQGYFIARPMPAAQLMPWISDWDTRRGKLPVFGS